MEQTFKRSKNSYNYPAMWAGKWMQQNNTIKQEKINMMSEETRVSPGPETVTPYPASSFTEQVPFTNYESSSINQAQTTYSNISSNPGI